MWFEPRPQARKRGNGRAESPSLKRGHGGNGGHGRVENPPSSARPQEPAVKSPSLNQLPLVFLKLTVLDVPPPVTTFTDAVPVNPEGTLTCILSFLHRV